MQMAVLYTASYAEESQQDLVRIGADGTWLWGQHAVYNIGNATDELYTYASRIEGGEYHIYRYFARDGGAAPFFAAPAAPYLVVSSDATDPTPAGQQAFHMTAEQWRTYASTWGMAADGYRLWVSNYRDNYVNVYDRTSGTLLGAVFQ